MRRNLILFLVLPSLALLYIISLSISPERVSLGDLERYEGSMVLVEGEIVDIRVTKGKNMVITLAEGGKEAKVFLHGKKDLCIGDRIEVLGRVERYRGEVEIVAKRIAKVEEGCEEMKLFQLSERPDRFLNKILIVSGRISYIGRDYLEIEDQGYRLKILAPIQGMEGVTRGDEVRVKGRLLYDPESFSYYMISTEVKRID